jgi:ADP-heptose:LPS heptosyltransferase
MIPLRRIGREQLNSVVRHLQKGKASTADFQAMRRFLFLQYETALGTAVHATPVFDALRRAVPDAIITVASDGLPFQVLQHNPNIDVLIRTPHPVKQWGRALAFFLAKLRPFRSEYDCVLTDSGNRRSCIAFLAFLTGVPTRIGFETRYRLYQTAFAYDDKLSIIANNLRLVAALGHSYNDTEPAVFFSQSEAETAKSLLCRQGCSESRPLVAFQTQTSGGEPNQWYDERFSELAEKLYRASNAQILFVGSAAEGGRINSIRARTKSPSHSVAGLTDIPMLAAVLTRCDLLVTLDTGTMHVGRAVNVPMVVIAPAKNPLHEWLPPPTEHIRVLIRKDIPCAQCRKLSCATRECMDEIRVSEVLDATLAQLKRFPPSQKDRDERTFNRSRRQGNEIAPRSLSPDIAA